MARKEERWIAFDGSAWENKCDAEQYEEKLNAMYSIIAFTKDGRVNIRQITHAPTWVCLLTGDQVYYFKSAFGDAICSRIDKPGVYIYDTGTYKYQLVPNEFMKLVAPYFVDPEIMKKTDDE